MSDLNWDDNEYPLAYLITFRTYGTWLHGDQRMSVDRHGKNVYGTEKLGLDPAFSVTMERNMEFEPLLLDGRQRTVVELAIRNVCAHRGFALSAINVRTNHAHIVTSAQAPPASVMNAFKPNATRELREAALIEPDGRVWSRGEALSIYGSRIMLKKPLTIRSTARATISLIFKLESVLDRDG